jgi:hypothetical protein
MTTGGSAHGGGTSGFGIAEEEEKPLGGTGGAAGGGTRAGGGNPSGEGIGLTDISDDEPQKEAAALGARDDHDETAALEYGEGDRPRPPTIGEALGSGAGTHVGSGTSSGHEGIGGGVPLEEEGDGTPAGTRSPGQDT